jgi:hypothetical protein
MCKFLIMIKYIFFFSIPLLITSCFEDQDKKTTLNLEVPDNKETLNQNVVDRIIYSKVRGMSCVMGCGGSIRKNLKSNCSVSKVEFDFIEGADEQVCRIYYNSLLSSEFEIKNAVEVINENQFIIQYDSILVVE